MVTKTSKAQHAAISLAFGGAEVKTDLSLPRQREIELRPRLFPAQCLGVEAPHLGIAENGSERLVVPFLPVA